MPVAMTTVEQASTLLDFNQKLDINLLDSVVSCFYSSDGPEVGVRSYYRISYCSAQLQYLSDSTPVYVDYLQQCYSCFPQQKVADQVLTQLKQHPDSWTRVDSILEFSKSLQTKVKDFTLHPISSLSGNSTYSMPAYNLMFLTLFYNLQYFALQVLETVIKTRWKVLPREQCEGKYSLFWTKIFWQSRLPSLSCRIFLQHLSFCFRNQEIHCWPDYKEFYECRQSDRGMSFDVVNSKHFFYTSICVVDFCLQQVYPYCCVCRWICFLEG